MKKLLILSTILFSFSVFAQSPEEVFNKTCSMCHRTGVGGAPIVGNSKDWAPRIAKGMDTLVEHTSNGIGIMPPKGGGKDLTTDQLQAVIEYMVNKSK